MNIKSISLENFQCYSGEATKNTFEFKKGLNIIIGDNGAGKSKLFDAFYWVLDDKIYDTGIRDFIGTSKAGKNLIADKAKVNVLPGKWVKTEVTLEVETNRYNYTLTRTYKIQKKENGDEADWLEPKNSELIMYSKDVASRKLISTDKDQNRIIEKILPNDMKPYLWYQGEAVADLIDFKKGHTLTKAINVLSDITRYDSYIDIAEKIYNYSYKEYRKISNKADKANKERKELEKKIDYYQEKLEQEMIERKEIAKELTYANEQYQKLMEKIEDAKDITEYKTKKEGYIKDYKRVQEELKNVKEQFNKKLFSEYWLLRNAQRLIDDYEELINEYEEKRQKKLVEKEAKNQIENKLLTRLPINVPEPIYVKRMLEQERCLVCDRPAEKGSDAYNKIKELIKASKEDAEIDKNTNIEKSDFHQTFKNLYNNGLSFRKDINRTDTKIREELNRIDKYEKELSEIKSELELLENTMSNYLASSGIQLDESEDIVNAFKLHQKNKEKKASQLEAKDRNIEDLKNKNKEAEKELRKLAKGSVDESHIKQLEALEDFKEI
ncbi:MAG: AAA family ATPase, partial [Nanoarchaeota archaeon]